jgi:hypothetical protein
MRTPGILVLAGLFIAAATGSEDGMAPPQTNGGHTRTFPIARRSCAGCEPRDYYPLVVGNTWIYRGGGIWTGTFLTLEITQSQVINGEAYFLLHGFPQQDYWLYEDDNGSMFAYDPCVAAPKLWWAFQAPPGQEYTTFLPGVCCGRAEVNSRNATYQGPIGQFNNALEILYPGVLQFGMVRELFLPEMGLVYRNQATGGPSYGSWDLIYARVGAMTVHSASELSFGVALDNSVYAVNMMPPIPVLVVASQMTVRITLRNSAQPIVLTFPTGQTFDFEIRNDRGKVVYRWSDGMAFTQVFRTETFGPGEKGFVIQARLAGTDRNPLPQGKYIAEGWLTTQGGKTYDATVGCEVRWLY